MTFFKVPKVALNGLEIAVWVGNSPKVICLAPIGLEFIDLCKDILQLTSLHPSMFFGHPSILIYACLRA